MRDFARTATFAQLPAPQPDVAGPAERFVTTQRLAAAQSTGVSHAAATAAAEELSNLRRTQMAPAAGGHGSLRMDRGKHTSGMGGGELLRIGADPSSSTAAQRAWVYGPDPALRAYTHASTPVAAARPRWLSQR
jgi:hypothetical protein